MARLRLKTGSILGTFGKGVDGSISLNFDVSGGDNCDIACPHHPDSTAENATNACYAARAEIRPDRSQLAAKLDRHGAMPPFLVVNRALFEIHELQRLGHKIPWLRISTNGSVPQPEQVDKSFRECFRRLLEWCRDSGIPVHFPTETYPKTRFYRALCGDLVTVRESVVDEKRFLRASGAVSVVVGSEGSSRIERVTEARTVAQKRRERTGRKVVVCPAVLNSFAARRDPNLKNDRAKCGACTACQHEEMDIVYPRH